MNRGFINQLARAAPPARPPARSPAHLWCMQPSGRDPDGRTEVLHGSGVLCFVHTHADEGFMATGATSDATDAKIQANIVAVGYTLLE